MNKIRLSDKMEQNKTIITIRKFVLSKTFMLIQALIAAAFVIMRDLPAFAGLDSYTMLGYGIVVIGFITCFNLVICDDIISTLLPFLLATAISIQCYDSFDFFVNFMWLVPIPVIAFAFHMIVYRKKFEWGKTWTGILAVAVAVTLGGLGKITAPEYFNLSALYHTVALGFGMLIMYLIMNSHYRAKSDYYVLRFHFAFIMTVLGIFCAFMVINHYILFWDRFLEKMSPLNFQWRNNVSTFLMLTMPFSFFLSTKKYPYLFLGFLQYAVILFTGSRGGALGGAAELALCLFAVVYSDKKNRKKTLIMIASVVVVILTLFTKPLLEFFVPVIMRIESVDIRAGLMTRAIEDFKSNILFGRGLGYMGNTDVHDPAKFALCWYHSAPFQVIGSFGLLGIICFTYQFYNRMKTIWKRVTHFNITLFISYAGLFLMSLVNPGEFCPLPYGMMATLLFIVCDKNNIAAANSDNTEKEDIVKINL
ncbi:MAG: O-antigen ligase family protein [Clostridia bacterium]|nr:O-antigen ligase family protein [Clostridia bacterium]